MACPISSSSSKVPTFLSVLGADEIQKDHPFSNPENREVDLKFMKDNLPRALSALITLIAQNKKQNYGTPDLFVRDDKEVVIARPNNIFIEFPDLQGETSMRYLVPNLNRFISMNKFFIIGFFGFKMETSTVIKQIWDLDDKLVGAIPTFDGILAYITIKKDDGEYFNYVFLESFEMVDKWRGLRSHESAVFYSPRYYHNVRINHAILPCSIVSLFENQQNINKLEIIRTKYYAFKDAKLEWSGLRIYQPDNLHLSIPYKQQPRPLKFASFLGCNAFNFYADLVSYIGRVTGLPVKMINVAELTRGISPRPSDIQSMEDYNIDFAFTCGISYVNYHTNLIPLAAPVRVEQRYGDKPIYFADIIVKADSPYHTLEDLRNKRFVINEQVSLSGHLMPQYHFASKGGLKKHFGEVLESASHANSIDYVVNGKAEAAAIDSVVLDMEFKQRPERQQQLRIIDSTAPCTMPPFVAAAWVSRKVQALVTRVITRMHEDVHNNDEWLRKQGFSRFAPVSDSDYESVRIVRKMYHQI